MATPYLPSMLHGLHPLHHTGRPSTADLFSPQWMISDTRGPSDAGLLDGTCTAAVSHTASSFSEARSLQA